VEAALGERRGNAPRPPLRRVGGESARQRWKPNGRDAALKVARGVARQRGPARGDAQPFRDHLPPGDLTYATTLLTYATT